MKKRNVGFILFGVAGANLIGTTLIYLRYVWRYERMGGLPIIYDLTYKISLIPVIILACAGVIVLIKFRKEKEITKIKKSDIEQEIYNFLKDNVNRAYSAKSIISRVFSEGFPEVSEDLVEDSLENLVQNDKIQKVLKENELFYNFKLAKP
jgi:hypothetical protein